MGSWGYGALGIWVYGDMGIWGYGDMGIWGYGGMGVMGITERARMRERSCRTVKAGSLLGEGFGEGEKRGRAVRGDGRGVLEGLLQLFSGCKNGTVVGTHLC